MATAFNKNYTELTNVNSGNQLQNGDDILGEHVNVALQNTAHLKDLTNNTVIRSASILNNILTLVLASKTNTGNVVTTNLNIDISNLNGVKAYFSNGGFYGNIINRGNEVAISVNDSEYTYEFRVSDDGVEYIYEEYDSESGTTTTYTTNLAKYPCFIKITHSSSNAEIYTNTITDVSFSDYTMLKKRTPFAVSIQATGKFDEAGHTYSVYSLKIYDNYIEVTGMRVVNGEFSSLTKQIISSQLTITGSIKIF